MAYYREDQCEASLKDCIYSRRCFMSGEYCSKQANIQKEREELHNRGEINAFVIMNFSNMSDVVYNWRLKPFIESLNRYLELDNNAIHCKAKPNPIKKIKPEGIQMELKRVGKVPVQKINVVRADTNFASNYVVCNRVCQQMQIADLIVVDVSSENTNVFYEFGMAVALGKLILPICYSESFFEIQIPEKLKEYEQRNPDKMPKASFDYIRRHIDCYPWRKNLFEHYGIRYRSEKDSSKLGSAPSLPKDQNNPVWFNSGKRKTCREIKKYKHITHYIDYQQAIDEKFGFSDSQYDRFPYREKKDKKSPPIGKEIYTRLWSSYNNSRYCHNTLIVYTLDGFLNEAQAGQCIVNYHKYIICKMKDEHCFCGDRVGVLIQPNLIPEDAKDAKTERHLLYNVGEIIHLGMNEATYAAQRETIKTDDFLTTSKKPFEKKKEQKANSVRWEEDILAFVKNHIRNKSISIYPSTPVFVKRVQSGLQKDILQIESDSEMGYFFCLYHIMLRTLKYTNEVVVDISQNPLQSLFWLGAAHGSNVNAITVQHEQSNQERTILMGSSENKERAIFDVAGLWSAILRSHDTEGFYRQLMLAQQGIEQHSKLMLKDLWSYEHDLVESLYRDPQNLQGDQDDKNDPQKIIQDVFGRKKKEEAKTLESFYRDRFWKPMLRYNNLQIYLPEMDGRDLNTQDAKLNTVKWDVDAIATLSHYLSKRKIVGEYTFQTLKMDKCSDKAATANFITVGDGAKPIQIGNADKGISLAAYIQTQIKHINKKTTSTNTGMNLIRKYQEENIPVWCFNKQIQNLDWNRIYEALRKIELQNGNRKQLYRDLLNIEMRKKEWNRVYKGFIYVEKQSDYSIFTQTPKSYCYRCMNHPEHQSTNSHFLKYNEIPGIHDTVQTDARTEMSYPYKETPCMLRGSGDTHTQLAQLVLWREVPENRQERVLFRVALTGVSGPSTLALSTLFVSDSQQGACRDNEQQVDMIKTPLSTLQAKIREKIMKYFAGQLDKKISTGKNPVYIEENIALKIKYTAQLYLSSVLYRHFLPFLSVEDEEKIINGMRYILASLLASEKLIEKNANEKKIKKYEDMAKATVNVLADILKNFRGVEAIYQVQVKTTSDQSRDSRQACGIKLLEDESYFPVNCLFVES